MDTRPDDELLRSARRDPEAFCAFYERHAPKLLNTIRRQVNPPEAATDLVAETFAQALVSLHRFHGRSPESAAAWLYGIARNLVFQFYRRARVETAARARLGMPIRSYGDFDDAEERADAHALLPAISNAVQSLSATEREAVNLRVVEELSYEEVADRQGVAVPAARMRVHRAVAALRIRLEAEKP